ncbi:MAG: hypothetical protein CSA22_08430 [Deltaproteobacteria bacterium]|nr:MAG: hypothetical protein CSA22_08430 [Deltaproteobacteria bacterium]
MRLLHVKFGTIEKQLEGDVSELNVGRQRTNDIVVQENTVSRQHGRFLRLEDGYYFEDLKSRNGSMLITDEGIIPVWDTRSPLPEVGWIRLGGADGPMVRFEEKDAATGRVKNPLKPGIVQLNDKAFDAATAAFEAVITEYPGEWSAYYFSGASARMEENWELAVRRFEQYLLVQPHVPVMMELAKIYRTIGVEERAVEISRRVVQLAPGNARAHAAIEVMSGGMQSEDPTGEQLPEMGVGSFDMATERVHPFEITGPAILMKAVREPLSALLSAAWKTQGERCDCWPKQTIPVWLRLPWSDDAPESSPDTIGIEMDPQYVADTEFFKRYIYYSYAQYLFAVITGFSDVDSWWLKEGFARMLTEDLQPYQEKQLQSVRKMAEWVSFAAAGSMPPVNGSQYQLAFTCLASQSFVSFICRSRGFEWMRQLFTTLKATSELNTAFKQMGWSVEMAELEWRHAIGIPE